MMDPEIEPPITVISFGGIASAETWDDNATIQMILSATPRFADEDFFYRCTRIEDFVLVKILVERFFRDRPSASWPQDCKWDTTLN
jgi:hypothetical protein